MPAGTDIDIDKDIDIETGTDIDIDPVREMKYGTDSKRGERYRKSRPGRGGDGGEKEHHCSGRISDSRQASSASNWAFTRHS